MSQYLTISAHHKDDGVDKSIELISYTTTPARRMSSEGIFPYTDEEKVITLEYIQEQIGKIQELLEEQNKFKEKYKSIKERNIKILIDVNNIKERAKLTDEEIKKSLNTIFENIDNANDIIDNCLEEFKEWKSYIHELNLVCNIAQNNEDWVLTYSNY